VSIAPGKLGGVVAIPVADLHSWDFTAGTDPVDHAAWPITAGSGSPLDEDGRAIATTALNILPSGRGLLAMWSIRTNLLLQSRTFTTTWTANRATPSKNAADAQSVVNAATTLAETATAGTHGLQQAISNPVASTYYGQAFLVKPTATRTRCELVLTASTAASAFFDLTGNGSVVSSTGTNVFADILPVGNGFYRVSLGFQTSASPGTTLTCELRIVSTGTTDSYTGVATNTLIVDHAVLWSAPTLPASPITTTTTTAAVTPPRMNRTWGSAQLAGSRIYRARFSSYMSATRALGCVDDGTNSNAVLMLVNPTTSILQCRISVGGVNTNANMGTVPAAGSIVSIGMAWDQAGASAYIAGGSVVSPAAVPPATLTREYLGAASAYGSGWDERLYKSKGYSYRLSDVALKSVVDAYT
jgi:hypothetical protein